MDRKILLGAALLVVLLAGILYLYQTASLLEGREEAAAGDLVERFGKELQNVSLLAPQATDLMEEHYGAYVAPELLSEWAEDPLSAPGRLTSSPWPNGIEVASVTRIGDRVYDVQGEIIEVTSVEAEEGGVAALRDVNLTVKRTGSDFLITEVVLGTYHTALKQESFSIFYPEEFLVGTGAGGYLEGQNLVKVSFPQDSFKGTNFIEGFLVVNRSEEPEECTEFVGVPGTEGRSPQARVVNGITFQGLEVAEGAAGNIYESRLFRTLHEGQCYEIALTVRTGNINNYPEGTVEPLQSQRALTELERNILATFRFVE